jgi:hypothetical protein
MTLMRKVKKVLIGMAAASMLVVTAGFSAEDFNVADLKHYRKEFKSESVGACTTSSVKTYEDYRMITATGSAQYKYIHNHMTVLDNGLLVDEEGFIGVALGYLFGGIGSRYYVELDSGITLPVVKVDEKADRDAPNGCTASSNDAIEFVIHSGLARDYFGGANGFVLNGNFNNSKYFRGGIKDIEKVLDERIELESGVTYIDEIEEVPLKTDEEGDGIIETEIGF